MKAVEEAAGSAGLGVARQGVVMQFRKKPVVIEAHWKFRRASRHPEDDA
jgi:hypothetical protein